MSIDWLASLIVGSEVAVAWDKGGGVTLCEVADIDAEAIWVAIGDFTTGGFRASDGAAIWMDGEQCSDGTRIVQRTRKLELQDQLQDALEEVERTTTGGATAAFGLIPELHRLYVEWSEAE